MAFLNIKIGSLTVLMDLNENDAVSRNIQYCLKQVGFAPGKLVTNTRYANTGFPYKFKDPASSFVLDPSKSLLEQGYGQRVSFRAHEGGPIDSENDPSTTSTLVRTLEIVDDDGNTIVDENEPPYPQNRHGQATIPIENLP